MSCKIGFQFPLDANRLPPQLLPLPRNRAPIQLWESFMPPPTSSQLSAHRTAAARADKLTSWKEIAAYLRLSERAAKRWEIERGLPVHRPPGKRGGVFAYASELEIWLRAPLAAPEGLTRHAFRRLWGTWVLIAVLTITACGAFLWIYRARTEAFLPKPSQTPPSGVRRTPFPGAEDAYLRGRYYWSLRTADSLPKAIDAYTQAIVKDPSYAEAYAGLAESYDLLPQFAHADTGDSYAKAKNAADRAIALNPALASAHRAKAFALFYWDWDIPGSDAEFKRALVLDQNSAETHQWYASTLQCRLEGREAIAQIDEAHRLNPASPAIAADSAYMHADFEDPDVGIRRLREIEMTQPTLATPSAFLAHFDFDRGDFTAYLQDLHKYATVTHSQDDLARADAESRGWVQRGKIGLLEARARYLKIAFDHGTERGLELGETLLLLGRKAEALPYFTAAFDRHEIGIVIMFEAPWAKPLFNDREYAKMLADARNRLHGNLAQLTSVPIQLRLPQ